MGPLLNFSKCYPVGKIGPFNRGAVIKVKRAPINVPLQTGLGV